MMLILLYVNGSLRRLQHLSAVQAIQFGAQADSAHNSGAIHLSEHQAFSANFMLALNDILARKQLYATMLMVIILAVFIMIVPQNLYHTLSEDQFVTYIGVENRDIRLDIQQTAQIGEKTADIGRYMENDLDIADYALFISKVFSVKLDNGETENLKVELGDHTISKAAPPNHTHTHSEKPTDAVVVAGVSTIAGNAMASGAWPTCPTVGR